MKTAVVNLLKISAGSTIASSRIAVWLSDLLRVPLIDNAQDLAHYNNEDPIENLIVVNAPPLFCGFRPELETATRKARRFIWVQNDYVIGPPSNVWRAIREDLPDLELHVWSAVAPDEFRTNATSIYVKREWTRHYVNWNQLTYSMSLAEEHLWANIYRSRVGHHLYYYGACREDRHLDFERFFQTNEYRTVISCTKRAQQYSAGKYSFGNYAEGGNITFIPPFESLRDVAEEWMTIYLEDKFSHTHFTSPANRFYECLAVGIPQLFADNTVRTMEKAGYDVRDFVVSSAKDVRMKLYEGHAIAKKQADWHRNYHLELEKQVLNAVGHTFAEKTATHIEGCIQAV